MSKLIFKAADVRRVVEHAIANRQSAHTDWSKEPDKDGEYPTVVPSEPTIILVHDDGVYLMSNGTPRDLIKARSPNGRHEVERSFVAYAEGMDPRKDEDWWDVARDAVGGDDFGEYLPWARELLAALDAGANKITVEVTKDSLSFTAEQTRRPS